MQPPAPTLIKVVLPVPLRAVFDYFAPAGSTPAVGARVRVPFRQRTAVGLILEVGGTPGVAADKIKTALEIMDAEPLLFPSLLQLNQFASDYYQHPLGEVMLGTLPKPLRLGQSLQAPAVTVIRLNDTALPASKKRAPRQAEALALLAQHPQGLTRQELQQAGYGRTLIQALLKKNIISEAERAPTPTSTEPVNLLQPGLQLPTLTAAQTQAIERINQSDGFQSFLLEGVTGSGKTEVYLRSIEHALAQGRQALVLVPEIGLTPQTLARFRQRFQVSIGAWHSALGEQERTQTWLAARRGELRILIGTRSAIFVPMPQLGIIIIDEEHDTSFKQQSGFRYSARDLALLRGRLENCSVVLGSATPALESLANIQKNRLSHLTLPERVGAALPPRFQLVDLRNQPLQDGLSAQLIHAVSTHLKQGNQVLLFINRRGFAPILMCVYCGWIARCKRCDVSLTLHHQPQALLCHHCGSRQRNATQCPQCQKSPLKLVGNGTERIEQALATLFPNNRILRIDRDSTRRKNSLQHMLDEIHSGQGEILLGTQMLTKGHHFPNVTLVAILDADSGLYSSDFRASERLGQLLIQVAGRAGRAEKPGEVYIQTYHPDHPLLRLLLQKGYSAFAAQLLQERSKADWPPFHHLALLRAEAANAEQAANFLAHARKLAERHADDTLRFLGPVPAPIERINGRFRAQLLFQAKQRSRLQTCLSYLLPDLDALRTDRRLRWSVDVDPIEMA